MALHALNPTVTGALIAGGAAVIGFGASAWNTRQSLRSSRDAEREQRLWEKRSSAYVALLNNLGELTTKMSPTAEELLSVQAALRGDMPAFWAYASPDVLSASLRLTALLETLAESATDPAGQKIARGTARNLANSELHELRLRIRHELLAFEPGLKGRLKRGRKSPARVSSP